MKKLISSLLVVVMCLGISGCGFMGEDVVAKINGDEVSLGLFNYYLYSAKIYLAQKNVDGDPEFWKTGTIDGKNAADVAKEQAMDAIARAYVIRQEAIKSGNDLTDADRQSIEATRLATVNSLGGQEAYEEALKPLGITDAVYVEILTNDKYEDVFYSAMRKEFKDEELQNYYTNDMRRIKHVLIANQDVDTGVALEGDKLAAAKVTAEDVARRAKAGEDFDTLVSEYSEDPGSKSKPDGYLLGENSSFEKPFLEASMKLGENEISDIVETGYGYHILKRYPIEAEKFQENIDDIRSDYWTWKIEQWKKAAKVNYNKSVYNAIDVSAQA